MGSAHADATPITIRDPRPPGWFDVAEVVDGRTLAEIAELRAELGRTLVHAQGLGERWRAARADVERRVAATIARGGRVGGGFDVAFAGWCHMASGLADLEELGALVARQFDGTPGDLDVADGGPGPALDDGPSCA